MRLFKANIQHLALVDRPASRHDFDIVKAEGAAVSFALYVPFVVEKTAVDGEVAGLAYVRPHEKDAVGDFVFAEDLQHMMETFEKNGRILNIQHKVDLRPDQATVTASRIRPDGSWYVKARILDPKIARDCRAGVYRGFSVGGTCQPKSAPKSEDAEREELVEMLAAGQQLLTELGMLPDAVDAPKPGPDTEKAEREALHRRNLEIVWNSRPR